MSKVKHVFNYLGYFRFSRQPGTITLLRSKVFVVGGTVEYFNTGQYYTDTFYFQNFKRKRFRKVERQNDG